MQLATSAPQPAKLAIWLRREYGFVIVVLGFAAIALHALNLMANEEAWGMLVDFHAFYISGKLVHEGLINDAYSLGALLEAQRKFTGTNSFMPWTYPPPFNLVVALLAKLPFTVSYFVFVSFTFAAYALVLYRLCASTFAVALWIAIPTSIVMIICGQNGFLTASIIGLFVILYMRSSPWAGAVLGLMIIKPHLALGIGLWLLFRMELTQLVRAGLVAISLCLAATFFLGPSVWTAFLGATSAASDFLKQGLYPLSRMTSVYAGLRSTGASTELAFTFHLAIAAGATGVIILTARRIADARTGLGIAILGSFFISPYMYDYDLPMLAIAITLLWRALSQSMRPNTFSAIVILSWCAGGGTLLVSLLHLSIGSTIPERPVSVGAIAMVSLALLILVTIRRGAVGALTPAVHADLRTPD